MITSLQNLVTEVQTKNKLIINQPEQTEKPMKDVAKIAENFTANI